MANNSFAVQAQPAATLSVNPATTPPGTSITVTWGGVAAPTAQDWIGLYAANAADNAFVAWRYTTGTASGNVPFSVPANLANGAYQVRLFSNNGFQLLASANFTIGNQLSLYFIHPDHLNTPRAVYDEQQQLRWRWDQAEPFGVNTPDENPVNLGAFEMPLRFPGQFADKETNLSYNYFRDYDAALGRYVQSDPVGLRGGLNTFSYVAGRPLKLFDKRGLDPYSCAFGGPCDPGDLPPSTCFDNPEKCYEPMGYQGNCTLRCVVVTVVGGIIAERAIDPATDSVLKKAAEGIKVACKAAIGKTLYFLHGYEMLACTYNCFDCPTCPVTNSPDNPDHPRLSPLTMDPFDPRRTRK